MHKISTSKSTPKVQRLLVNKLKKSCTVNSIANHSAFTLYNTVGGALNESQSTIPIKKPAFFTVDVLYRPPNKDTCA